MKTATNLPLAPAPNAIDCVITRTKVEMKLGIIFGIVIAIVLAVILWNRGKAPVP